MFTTRSLSFLFSVPTIVLLSCSNVLAQDCKIKTISGLPHSFTGVSRCQNDNEWASEAQSRCQAAITAEYPTSAFRIRQLFTPTYRGNLVVEDKCKREVLGQCVDYYRECTATFSELNCQAEVCRRKDSF
ncbi:hypothetical protein [Nostoc sp. UIC 10630]|uniref:hypothetical protein n=1 Tax=Nostoc sp. UIC 10630 TaxID=2100146 RepID=UPI0013F8ECA9|nr:hypothetical protein [Nostoc sp. UIC 10630]NEU83225.1 hypothetical protein [Nostoc sp. UIC 10630]